MPWMNRFDNQIISTREQFEARLAYLHNEPVRRGLAARTADWEFSSARDWLPGEPGLIRIEKDLRIFPWWET